jgi:hypothetical protein
LERAQCDETHGCTLPGDIDIRFSTIPSSIVRDADGVDVTFTSNVDGSTSAERFDADDRAC